MAEKTRKSNSKRIKVTATGKTLVRNPGRNHYNAKQTRTEQQSKKGLRSLNVSRRVLSRNMPHSKAGNR